VSGAAKRIEAPALTARYRMVPIASFYLGQEPPNAATVHELVNRSRAPAPAAEAAAPQGGAPGGSVAAVQAAGHSEPPSTPSTAATPVTAETDVVTPGSIPRIDASLAEDSTPAVVSSEPLQEPEPTEVVGATTQGDATMEEGEKTPVTARDTELPSYDEPSPQSAPVEKAEARLPELDEDTDASFDDVSLSAADESARAPPADDDESEEVDLS